MSVHPDQPALFELPRYGAAYCAICGRELSNPNSIKRGIGPICAARYLRGDIEEMDHHDLPLRIDLDPKDHGFVLRRLDDGSAITNVPHSAIHHSPTGFEWGYGGSGPADLALNILEYVIKAESLDKWGKVDIWKGKATRRAWALHQDFKWAFIAGIDQEGDTIPYNAVKAWIEDQPRPDFVEWDQTEAY